MSHLMFIWARGKHKADQINSSRTDAGIDRDSVSLKPSVQVNVSESKLINIRRCMNGCMSNPLNCCIIRLLTVFKVHAFTKSSLRCLSLTSGVPTLPEALQTSVPQATKRGSLEKAFFWDTGTSCLAYWFLLASKISSSRKVACLVFRWYNLHNYMVIYVESLIAMGCRQTMLEC